MILRAIFSISAIALLCACSGGKPGLVGQVAPAFDEPTSTGSKLSLASLKGKVVYLNFFASWCPPCNEEAASVNALQKKYGPAGLQVVGVDILENAAKAESFRKAHRLSYPAVVDSGTLSDFYSINGLPVHVFIDRIGVIRKIEIGELTRAEMEADIRAIL